MRYFGVTPVPQNAFAVHVTQEKPFERKYLYEDAMVAGIRGSGVTAGFGTAPTLPLGAAAGLTQLPRGMRRMRFGGK